MEENTEQRQMRIKKPRWTLIKKLAFVERRITVAVGRVMMIDEAGGFQK